MPGVNSQFMIAREARATVPAVTAGASTAGVPNKATLTFTSAHGISKGDRITITGATPSTWNGTWIVAGIVDATHLYFYTPAGSALVALSSTMPTVTATGYGAGTTPNRSLEINSESLKSNPMRLQGQGIHAGERFDAADRMVAYLVDSSGDVTLDLLDKAMGIFWEHALGSYTVSAANGDGMYTKVYTAGSLRGKTINAQKGVQDNNETTWPITFPGSHIDKLVLTVTADQLVTLTVSFDGKPEIWTTALAAQSWPSSANLMSFLGGTLTVDTVAVNSITSMTITIDNQLKKDRHFIGTSVKGEDLEVTKRKVTVDFTAKFDDQQFAAKFGSSIPSGTLAAISLGLVGPVATGATYPSTTIALPAVQVNGDTPVISGLDEIEISVNGEAKSSVTGANDAITVTEVCLDALP